MSQKTKGSNVERELVHAFWEKQWTACRVAGSGSMHYPSPDIIAGIRERKVIIECKSSVKEQVYLEKKEVGELQEFADRFGGEPWIAVRFSRTEWFFLRPDELSDSEKSLHTTKTRAVKIGRTFQNLITMGIDKSCVGS